MKVAVSCMKSIGLPRYVAALMAALTVVFMIHFIFFVNSAAVVCKGAFVNPLTDVSWECMFPIRLAGVRVSPSPPDPESYISTPLCSCQDGQFTRVGMVIGYREPAYMVDVVKDAWCFAGFGIDMGTSSIWGDGSAGEATSTKAPRQEYSAHTHSFFDKSGFSGIPVNSFELVAVDASMESRASAHHGHKKTRFAGIRGGAT